MATSVFSVARTTAGSLIVGLAALAGIVAMTFWLSQQSQDTFNRVIAARDARTAAVELRDAIQAAESSQRGYLISGNEIYLAPYGTAKAHAERRLAGVIADLNTSNRLAGSHLEQVVREKFVEMDRSIALRRDRRDEDAFTFFNQNRGKALMDEANVFFAGIIRAADERLTTAAAEESGNAARLRWATILGGVVILTVVGLAAVTIRHYTQDLAAARDQVEAVNAGLEETVKHRTADLARANEEITRFAHIVAHDLRAPLVNIVGFAGELEAGLRAMRQALAGAGEADIAPALRSTLAAAADDDMPEAIGFIRSSAAKMDALIGAVLKLAREGRRSLDPQPLDLAPLIRAQVDAVRHQILAADGEVAYDIDVGRIVSDRLSLEQIVGNLLDNAVKYRSPGRPFRLAIRARGTSEGGVDIEVADNGRGIAERDLGRVFEMFTRAGARDQSGEGMGLAFVQALVRNLGGEITVASTLDVGTTFRVVLPSLDKPV